ncbi:MAG: hypothetical protein DRZ76_02960 [Candidatus Nealsonbacteria bacterium]|nr:MAG: hypothetical protein DRZ76_02960 [Candidatus Nealsonbacteria bacterium]
MVKIKPIDQIVKKWTEVTPGRAPYYEAGIRNPREDWATRAAAAESAWASGVQDAITQGRFAKGVKRAGTEKWQRKALEVGTRRWPEGIRAAAPDYQSGFAPYHDTLARLTLPERGARGDPKNIERVRVIAQALHKKRLELLGGGGT